MSQELVQQLTAALREAVRAWKAHQRFDLEEGGSLSLASRCDAALRAGESHQPTPDQASQTYQGWKNRETWAVGLHLSNEQAAYETCRAIAEDCGGNIHLLADRLSSYVVPGYLRFSARITNPMCADVLEAAIARIDFTEIAEDFLNE